MTTNRKVHHHLIADQLSRALEARRMRAGACTLIILLTALLLAAPSAAMAAEADTDSIKRDIPPTLWIKQLWDNGFHINDPGVDYPRFPRFLRNIYNWGDRTFNSYDPEYVVATGKNWKLQGKSYNWGQTYSLFFKNSRYMNIRSHVYADVGAYISFMAVSLGYMWNANELFGIGSGTRTNFNVNFTCALFTIDYTHQTSHGGAKITKVKTGNNTHVKTPVEFNDLSNSSSYLTAYYFGNHRRYSHAAAYCFSKYQLKSAGSWLAGFSWMRQDIEMDFTEAALKFEAEGGKIPDDIPLTYQFFYDDYTLQGGYGYNWALKPAVWLVNVTTLAGLGYKHSRVAEISARHNFVAFDALLSFSAVYNHKALFLSLQGKWYSSVYPQTGLTFFNTLPSLQFIVGMRF